MARDTKRIIEDTVRTKLPVNAVEFVTSREEEIDGEPIWRVTVALKNPRKTDRAAMLSLIRHLRNALQDDRFPIVEFMSISDARKRDAA